MTYPIESSPMFNAIHDMHNNALKFKVSGAVDWPIQDGFRGGGIQSTTFKGFRVKKTKNWLIIYYNRRERVPLSHLSQTADTIITGMINLAKDIADRYGLQLDPTPLPFSSNRPEIKTPYKMDGKFIEAEDKQVYNPPNNYLELNGQNAKDNALNLTQFLVKNMELQKIQIENTLLEIHNKEKHDAVLEGILKAQQADIELRKEMRDALKVIGAQRPSVFSAIKKLIFHH